MQKSLLRSVQGSTGENRPENPTSNCPPDREPGTWMGDHVEPPASASPLPW
jgi:hypothetical protein